MWKIILLYKKGILYFQRNGFIKLFTKIRAYLSSQHGQMFHRPQEWVPTLEELQNQRNKDFDYSPLISIIVPIYNTPILFLKAMVTSVCLQSYINWQLCVADGSDQEHKEVIRNYFEGISAQFSGKIKYQSLEVNKGISENTNACISMAEGDYLALLDHDDVLSPDALFEVVKVIDKYQADFIYSDEATFSKTLEHIVVAHFKPDFAPDNLRANNYICHFTVFSKELIKKTGYFRKEYDGSQDHDLFLRLTDQAKRIVHIPKVLYYWRMHKNSVAADIGSKAYAIEAGKKAVLDYLLSHGIKTQVESLPVSSTIYRIKYELIESPLISVIVSYDIDPNSARKCIESIKRSTYQNLEIILIEKEAQGTILAQLSGEDFAGMNVRICQWRDQFDHLKMLNFAVTQTKGKYLIFLHEEARVITPNWIEEMLMFAQRPDVGAVGAKIYNQRKIEDAGIILGGKEGHVIEKAFHGFSRRDAGYMNRLCYAQDVSAVSGTCLMVKRELFEELGGFDEKISSFYWNVDFCMKLRKKKLLIVFTPFAELLIQSSKKPKTGPALNEAAHLQVETQYFKQRWQKELISDDPYFGRNIIHFVKKNSHIS